MALQASLNDSKQRIKRLLAVFTTSLHSCRDKTVESHVRKGARYPHSATALLWRLRSIQSPGGTMPQSTAGWVGIFSLAGLVALTGCATTLTTIQKTCGTGTNVNQCSGTLEVPVKDTALVRQGVQIAISHVYSDAFANEVERFMTTNPDAIQAHSDWASLTPAGIVSNLRANMDEARLGTYDGFRAWYYHHMPWIKNLAFEASETLPARINRWGIPGRSAASIANTIVHEGAHAADLTHYDENNVCAPPYVLGEIVQRLENDASENMVSHCSWFDEATP